MGGMYTEMLYGYDRICVNPAFQMADTMHEHGMMGKQVFQNPRADGIQEFIVTKALVKEYREMTEQCFAQADSEEEQRRVWGLFGDEDPTVHTFDLFRQHYRQAAHLDILSTPAHDHIVFTNQPHLLYGDYMVSASAMEGFMGTAVPLGSEEMKTWEEAIIYFERLGGQ